MEKRNLNIKEASEYSGLSISYLYKRSAKRDLPILKCGSRVLIPKRDFEAWLEKHRVGNGERGG